MLHLIESPEVLEAELDRYKTETEFLKAELDSMERYEKTATVTHFLSWFLVAAQVAAVIVSS